MNFGFVILAAFGMIGLLMASLSFWSWVVMRLRDGLPVIPRRFREQRADVPTGIFLLIAAYAGLGLLLQVTAEPAGEFNREAMQRAVNISLIDGLISIVVLAILLFLTLPNRPSAIRLGFRCDQILLQLTYGLLGFVAAVGPVLMVLYLSSPMRSEETTHAFLKLLSDIGVGPGVVPILLTAIVVAPLKEELMYRVILQSWLVRRCGTVIGIGLSAIVFSFLHGFRDGLGLLPLSIVLGVLYHQRSSYLAVVTTHGLFNGFNIAIVLFQVHYAPLLESPAPA